MKRSKKQKQDASFQTNPALPFLQVGERNQAPSLTNFSDTELMQ